MVGVTTRKPDKKPVEPLADVPLSVFSQSSSLMSDRAAQAMEKALRNLAHPSEETKSDLKVEKGRGFKDEEFLKEIKSDQRNFVKRDAADLFTAPALVNDKDGKLTAREMSLPSAFYSRGEDQTHADEITDSDDGDVNHRAMRSVTVSGPLGSDRSLVSESETDGGRTGFLESFAAEDLDLVESAILRLLREDDRGVSKQQDKDVAKSKDTPGVNELEGSEGSQSPAGDVDLQLLSRLLDQVHSLRDQIHQRRQIGRAARLSSRSGRSPWDVGKRPGGKEKKLKKDDMRKAVESATQAAKSASEAAKAAASLVTKNSDAVSKLLHTLKHSSKSTTEKGAKEKLQGEQSGSEKDSEQSSDSEDTKDIAKKIVAQNRYTHVVLGIMLVSSFVWRYIVVKVAKRVKSKVSDPWGYVGGVLTDGFRGPGKESDAPVDGKPDGPSFPQINLPPLLQAERKEEDAEAVVTDTKEKQRVLNFGNILQIKPNNSAT